MSQAFSDNTWFGVGGESTLGTAVSRTKFHEFHSESVKQDGYGLEPRNNLYGTSQSRKGAMKRSSDGDIEVDFQVNGMEWLFKNAMGSLATTGTNPYTHTFSLARALPTGLTVEVNRDATNIGGSSSFNYPGCNIGKLSLKHSPGEFLKGTISLVGQGLETLVAPSSASFATFAGFDWGEFSVTVDGTALSINSLDELTIDNNLSTDRYAMGAVTRKGFGRAGQRKITIKMTAEFDSLTALNYYRNSGGGPHAIVLAWANAALLATFTVTLPVVYFTAGGPTAGDAGPLVLQLEGTAYVSSAQNDEMTAVLVNSTVGTGIP